MVEQARVVIVGGGVAGCGLAWQLCKLGWSDVLLLEKNDLTAGATWHAAGHVMHYANSAVLTRLLKETTDLFPLLEAETGQPVGFHRTGGVRLILGDEQMVEHRRVLSRARFLGVDMELVGPEEVKRLFPPIVTDGVLAGLHTPGDGHTDPSSLTFAFARGARTMGARLRTGVKVTAMRWLGSEWELETTAGPVRAEYVVNCAGMWAQEIANMVGVTLPLIVFMHQHLVTEEHPAVAALERELVLIRDPAGGYNVRQEGKGFCSGVYEHAPEFVFENGIPPSFGQELMTPNLDRSADFIARAIARVPALGEVGLKMVYNGPTSRTPDHQPLFGPVPGVPNHFIAAGFAAGIGQSGFTKYLAQWIAAGEPGEDLSELHVARFGVAADRAFAFDTVRAAHSYTTAPSYPYGERQAGRPAVTGALYDRHLARRACMGVRGGVEVANWYAPEGTEPKERTRFGRPAWYGPVAAECRALAAGAGLVDLSHLSTFEAKGPDAAALLERALAGPLPGVGRAVRRAALTARGTVATIYTVIRPEADRFLLVGPGESRVRDFDELRRRPRPDERAELADLSGATGRLLLSGPQAGAILARAARADLAASQDGSEPPEGSALLVHLSYVPALVVRLDETGHGDRLLIAPVETMRRLDDVLREEGRGHGLAEVGVRAWDALRLEAGVPAMGLDVDRACLPSEAGLAAPGGPRRLVLIEVEAEGADAYRFDPVFAGGRPVGLVGTGGFGHLGGRSLALALIAADCAAPGTPLEVAILGERRNARVAGVQEARKAG